MRKTLFMVLAVAVLLSVFAASGHAADWGFSVNDYQAAVNEGASSGGPGQKCFEIGLKVVGGNVEGLSFIVTGKTIVEVFRPGSQPRYDQDIMNRMRKHIQNMGLMFSHMQLSEEKFKKVRQDFVDYANNTKIDFYLVDAQRKYAGYVLSFMSMLTTDSNWTSWRGHALTSDGTFRLSASLRHHLAVGAPFTVGLYPPGEKLYKNNPILATAPFITKSPETRIQLTTGTAQPPVTPQAEPKKPPVVTPPTPSGSNEWVLVGVTRDKEGGFGPWTKVPNHAEDWAKVHHDYRYKFSASPNSVTIVETYVGANNPNLPIAKGASVTCNMEWTSPPSVIKPDQEFAVQISANIVTRTGGAYSQPTMLVQAFGSEMKTKDGKSWFTEAPILATVYGKFPSGSKGAQRTVIVTANLGGLVNGVKTSYTYEWR